MAGEKDSVLAISEPFAGSDVAALRATAEKSPCGMARPRPFRRVQL